MLNQAADHVRFEDVGVVCYRTDNALRSLVHVYIQCELRGAGWNVRLCCTPATFDSGNRRFDRDRHLKKWVTAWIGSGPNGFNQFSKRYIAVRQRTQNRFPHANQQLLKCWVPANIDSKWQDVHKISCHLLQFRKRSARSRCAENDVRLTRVAVQHGSQPCDQDHEQRNALLLTKSFQILE